MTTGWFSISADDWKHHAVPAVFVEALIAEMHERGFKGELVRKPIEKWGIDRGGMCYQDRPWEHFQVDGLRLGMASEHVGYFRAKLREMAPRTFGERTYYKLHSHWNCVVLTAAQRQGLLAALGKREARASERADAFDREMEQRLTGGGAP